MPDAGPCSCWTRVPRRSHGGHCCWDAKDPDGEIYQRGKTPPCGHWHPDVPRPPKFTEDQAHAWARRRCIDCLTAPARAGGYRCDPCHSGRSREEASA